MAAGSITTLPALPEDGSGGTFPPGTFKDPKRLYCKNGGFFLRINPDGRVDGVREKSDSYSRIVPWLCCRPLDEHGRPAGGATDLPRQGSNCNFKQKSVVWCPLKEYVQIAI